MEYGTFGYDGYDSAGMVVLIIRAATVALGTVSFIWGIQILERSR